MTEDEEFRMQVCLAAEFMTATLTFEGAEFLAYMTRSFDNIKKVQDTLVGMQAILSFALNHIARLDGTYTTDLSQTILHKLREIMLSFHEYDQEIGR